MRRFVQPVLIVFVFVSSWFLRFNDPEGGFGGLTDDHFFYLVRGWQMLYGDLPYRDFVDPGAPLTFAIAALVQMAMGRGTWSEVVFCVTALSAASAVTYWLARRASGSTAIGLLAAGFQIALAPRFYNYPKVLIYAVAIPALWAYVDRPTALRRAALALLTVVAFLMRHDHGVFVGLAMAVTIAVTPTLTLKARAREAILYGVLTLAMVSPYLIYLQANGGAVEHFRAANSWAQRDRGRAPLIVPPFTLSPRPDEDPPDPDAGWWQRGPFVGLRRNYETWMFWCLWALPIGAAGALLMRKDALRPEWPHARVKVLIVAFLAVVLNIGFLRGNLEVRFGDVSVPQAILLAWAAAAWLWLPGSALPSPIKRLVAAPLLLAAIVTGLMLIPTVRERLDLAGMAEWPPGIGRRYREISSRLQQFWPLESWSSPDENGPMALAFYLRDCTAPDDRVFISPYLPHVPALAQRAFGGGHTDLRPSFFVTDADQRLTVARLQRQAVPIVVLPTGDDYQEFIEEFPRVAAYLASRYTVGEDVDFGDELVLRILVDNRRTATRQYEPLGAPCFR